MTLVQRKDDCLVIVDIVVKVDVDYKKFLCANKNIIIQLAKDIVVINTLLLLCMFHATELNQLVNLLVKACLHIKEGLELNFSPNTTMGWRLNSLVRVTIAIW